MKRIVFTLSIAVSISGLWFLPTAAHAQSAIINNSVFVSVSPESPQPFKNTSITLTSFSLDLDKSNIIWSLNGKTSLSGIGKKSFSFTTGAVGTVSTIDIAITIGSNRVDKKVIIQPTSIDLLWEALDSYTPPFYKGKAMPIKESQIKVVAIPNTKTPTGQVKPENLVYNWKQNFSSSQSSSGYGKSSFIFRNDYLNPSDQISLEASAVSQGFSAAADLVITPGKPSIVFYEKNPLRGVDYAKALTNSFNMQGDETTIVAEPYFFSLKNGREGRELIYSWYINNEQTGTIDKMSELLVRAGDQSGTAKLFVKIKSVPWLFQGAQKTLDINLVR
ncbi:MAG: hypothetical protein WC795_02125 [Candidatus Paceibacterota bacterium]|jgi:hypothetical protein